MKRDGGGGRGRGLEKVCSTFFFSVFRFRSLDEVWFSFGVISPLLFFILFVLFFLRYRNFVFFMHLVIFFIVNYNYRFFIVLCLTK